MVRVLINVPKDIRANEPFDVKVLISHPMESGQRRDQLGLAIPRDIINHFICALDGETVLEAELFPAIAANPFLSFSAVTEKSGILTLTFTDDHGVTQTETVSIIVT
jgi:sulfur-oxidizing protein SoxZ